MTSSSSPLRMPTYALRATTAPSTMGVRQRVCCRGGGGLVKADNGLLRPGETATENRPVVNVCDTNPAGDSLADFRNADNTALTHDRCPPTNTHTGPNSALRTTTVPPTMGVHQRVCLRGGGGLVKADDTVFRPGEIASENRSLVKFFETTLPYSGTSRTVHCGQPGQRASLAGAHELYDSTKQSLCRRIDLGERGIPVESCTTGTRMMRRGRIIFLGGKAHLADFRIADNHGPTNNGSPPTNPSRIFRRGRTAATARASRR